MDEPNIAPLRERSKSASMESKRKLVVALVAGVVAGWVAVTGITIDPTLETLIAAAAPLIVAYWWPMPHQRFKDPNAVARDLKSGIGAPNLRIPTRSPRFLLPHTGLPGTDDRRKR
jgi:hypothetical protein